MSPDELRARRYELGLSQDQLAIMLGVSQSALSLWENGKREPDAESIAKLAVLMEAKNGAPREEVRR